jgi:hypothetical protein
MRRAREFMLQAAPSWHWQTLGPSGKVWVHSFGVVRCAMRQKGSAAGGKLDATSCRDAAVILRTHPGFHGAARVAASRLVDAYNSNGLMIAAEP